MKRLKYKIFPRVLCSQREMGIDLMISESLPWCLELEIHRGDVRGLWVLSFLTPNLENHLLPPVTKKRKKYFASSGDKIKFSKVIWKNILLKTLILCWTLKKNYRKRLLEGVSLWNTFYLIKGVLLIWGTKSYNYRDHNKKHWAWTLYGFCFIVFLDPNKIHNIKNTHAIHFGLLIHSSF